MLQFSQKSQHFSSNLLAPFWIQNGPQCILHLKKLSKYLYFFELEKFYFHLSWRMKFIVDSKKEKKFYQTSAASELEKGEANFSKYAPKKIKLLVKF